MDDDTKTRQEFILHTEDGTPQSVTMARPGPGQLLILAMSRTGSDAAGVGKTIGRILRVMEALAGPDWSKIEDLLLEEAIGVEELFKLVDRVFTYDWDALEQGRVAQPQQTVEDPAPVRPPTPSEVAAFMAKHGVSAGSYEDAIEAYPAVQIRDGA